MSSPMRKPDWTPDDAGDAFATRIVAGVGGGHDGMSAATPADAPRGGSRRPLSVDDYAGGVLAGARAVLARAITLIESNAPAHFEQAQEVLRRLLPHSDARKIILPGLHPLSGQQRTATRATARVGGADLLLYSTHIEIATAPVELRVAQMAAVLADVPDAAEWVIIGGDYNVVTGEGVETLAEQYAAGGLDHATPGLGPTLTRYGVRPSATDHLFTRGFAVLDAGVLGDVSASDHFPVWARLGWGIEETTDYADFTD